MPNASTRTAARSNDVSPYGMRITDSIVSSPSKGHTLFPPSLGMKLFPCSGSAPESSHASDPGPTPSSHAPILVDPFEALSFGSELHAFPSSCWRQLDEYPAPLPSSCKASLSLLWICCCLRHETTFSCPAAERRQLSLLRSPMKSHRPESNLLPLGFSSLLGTGRDPACGILPPDALLMPGYHVAMDFCRSQCALRPQGHVIHVSPSKAAQYLHESHCFLWKRPKVSQTHCSNDPVQPRSLTNSKLFPFLMEAFPAWKKNKTALQNLFGFSPPSAPLGCGNRLGISAGSFAHHTGVNSQKEQRWS